MGTVIVLVVSWCKYTMGSAVAEWASGMFPNATKTKHDKSEDR
jgi:hypothetical protein